MAIAWLRAGAAAFLGRFAEARRRDPLAWVIMLMLLMFGLALGPPHGLWQYVYWMPVFSFIRMSSRFSIVWLLTVGVLAGAGFDRMTRGWTRRGVAIGALAVYALLIAEYAAIPLTPGRPSSQIPPIDRWLSTRPTPFVIAEQPATSERDQTDYMLHSTAHWQKTIQGYHGWRSLFHTELNADMMGFPDDRSLKRLTELGVTYVVVHTDRYAPEDLPQVEKRLQRFESRLRLEHVEGPGRVYAVVSPSDGSR